MDHLVIIGLIFTVALGFGCSLNAGFIALMRKDEKQAMMSAIFAGAALFNLGVLLMNILKVM